VSFRIGLTMPL